MAAAERTIDIRQTLTSGGRGMLVMTASTLVASLIAQSSIGRSGGPAELGAYGGTTVYILVLAAFFLYGVPLALSQRVAELESSGASAAGIERAGIVLGICLGAMGAIVAGLLWDAVATAIRLEHSAHAALVGVATWLLAMHSVTVHLFLARLDLRTVTTIVVAQPVAVIVGVISAPDLGGSELAVLGITTAGALAIARLVAAGIGPAAPLSDVRALARGAVSATPALHTLVFAHWLDRAIVAFIAGPVGLGALTAASSIADAILRMPRNLGTFGVPAYARLLNDAIGTRRVLESHLRILGAFFLIASMPIIAASEGLVTLIYGENFEIAKTALRLLTAAILPMGISLAIATSALGQRSANSVRIMAALLSAQLVIGTALTSVFSAAGTALGSLIVWSLGAVLYARAASDVLGDSGRRALLKLAGSAAPLWVTALVLGESLRPWPLPAALAAVVGISAVGVVVLDKSDWRLLFRLVGLRRPGHPT